MRLLSFYYYYYYSTAYIERYRMSARPYTIRLLLSYITYIILFLNIIFSSKNTLNVALI